MNIEKILQEIQENIQTVIKRDTPLGNSLWKALVEMHPADIADFLENSERENAQALFAEFPQELKLEIFTELSDSLKVHFLSY